MKYLKSFGEMAVIAISDGKKMRSKLDTRGRTGIFVGYADDHAGNVYRFINIQTKEDHPEQRCTMAELILETI